MSYYVPLFIALVLVILFFWLVPVRLWITALASGSHVSIFTLIGMKLRRVPPARIVIPLIQAKKAGLPINSNQLETHYMAGGRVDVIVNALIAASRAGIVLPFEMAAAIDLAGRDVLEAVKMSVNPKVIETPNISAVAKDGIELLVKARVTVRTNITKLVGGAGEATVIARIGEGIVTTVGSADSHKSVLENPDDISKTILAKGLDAGTAYQILSIDIADIDIGRNIGAHLLSLQAEADKNIAQAKAEERRAAAVAREQEMKAAVVEAEAEVPKALAEALRNGRMGIMDYYDMQNIKADTRMRESIAGEDKSERLDRPNPPSPNVPRKPQA
ncbi:MAG: flotillin-like protein FloA [Lachnospira sp.]